MFGYEIYMGYSDVMDVTGRLEMTYWFIFFSILPPIFFLSLNSRKINRRVALLVSSLLIVNPVLVGAIGTYIAGSFGGLSSGIF